MIPEIRLSVVLYKNLQHFSSSYKGFTFLAYPISGGQRGRRRGGGHPSPLSMGVSHCRCVRGTDANVLHPGATGRLYRRTRDTLYWAISIRRIHWAPGSKRWRLYLVFAYLSANVLFSGYYIESPLVLFSLVLC